MFLNIKRYASAAAWLMAAVLAAGVVSIWQGGTRSARGLPTEVGLVFFIEQEEKQKRSS